MIKKAKVFKYFAFSLFVVFILNTLASLFFWYSTIPQFDMFMHFIGGFTASLFSYWVLFRRSDFWLKDRDFWKFIRVNILCVIVIALLWEVMEFSVQDFFNVTVLADLPDSVSDVLMGILGAILSVFLIVRKNKRHG